jgi:hypothetical protein
VTAAVVTIRWRDIFEHRKYCIIYVASIVISIAYVLYVLGVMSEDRAVEPVGLGLSQGERRLLVTSAVIWDVTPCDLVL